MAEVTNAMAREGEPIERVAAALESGVLLGDAEGRIVWMDDAARTHIDGAARQISLPLPEAEVHGIECVAAPLTTEVDGREYTICVLQQAKPKQLADIIGAFEEVMADSANWFTRTVVDRIKSLASGSDPKPSAADLNILSDREREVLGYICEGRSDAQMGELMGLSQNTVRNHIGALYRKIGVNRRTAAVIWARDRGVTGAQGMPNRQRRKPVSKRRGNGEHSSSSY